MQDIAVVGCGYWGKNLARNFFQLGALRVVCDPSPQMREVAQKMAPGIPFTSSFEEVLASRVPAVALATPAETHYRMVLQALQAGKDVFVEKPLALTHTEGVHLVSEARKLGRILMVGHVLEYHPGVRRLIELARSGELGEIHYIYSNRLSLGKVRREENILWSFAPHDIALILRLLGQMPVSVSAAGGNYIQPNVADLTVTNLLFENQVRAHIFVSWLHPFKEQRLVVIGSRKMASFDDVNRELMLYDQRVEIHDDVPTPVKGQGEKIDYSPDEPLRLECEAFISAIQTREAPLTDGESGARVLAVLQAAQQSLEAGGLPTALPG